MKTGLPGCNSHSRPDHLAGDRNVIPSVPARDLEFVGALVCSEIPRGYARDDNQSAMGPTAPVAGARIVILTIDTRDSRYNTGTPRKSISKREGGYEEFW